MTTKTGTDTEGPNTSAATVEHHEGRSQQADDAPERGDVASSVERDLAKLPEELARSGTAALCLALAREIDDASNSATSKSMCAKALMDAQDSLRALTPVDEKKDELDDLASRRAQRIAGGAAASNL